MNGGKNEGEFLQEIKIHRSLHHPRFIQEDLQKTHGSRPKGRFTRQMIGMSEHSHAFQQF